MGRKRLTQLFPWLLPLRKWQRKLFFYGAMQRDKNTYAQQRRKEHLKYLCFRCSSEIINPNTGYDIIYQLNKEHNLGLACETLDGLLIQPGETFSFWQRVRHAEERACYRDGLSLTDGKIVFSRGGGLCQLSNELFWCFLHTPLTILERHPHAVLDFPSPDGERPVATDAAVSEGWQDLKMQNDTTTTWQLVTKVDEGKLICEIYCDRPVWDEYEIFAAEVQYYKQREEIYQRAKLYRRIRDKRRPEIPRMEHWLYENRTRIGYPLPKETEILEHIV